MVTRFRARPFLLSASLYAGVGSTVAETVDPNRHFDPLGKPTSEHRLQTIKEDSADLPFNDVDGPLQGKVVVLIHHAVLQALLEGTLVSEQAIERGLLVFTDGDTKPVQRAFRQGFSPGA